MALLKKIKASTLMETLVATILIMVIFMIASMILNNLFSTSIKNNTRAITAQLNTLHYQYINEKLKLPYYDDLNHWVISVELIKTNKRGNIQFKATNKDTKKTITLNRYKS